MAHLELDVTPTGYVLHRIAPEGSQLVERFDTDEQGARKLLATLHQELDREGETSGLVLAEGYDREVAMALRDAIDLDEDAGHTLRAFSVELGRSDDRFPNA